jgi:hypothetical protein
MNAPTPPVSGSPFPVAGTTIGPVGQIDAPCGPTDVDAARRDAWERHQAIGAVRGILLGLVVCSPFWLAVAVGCFFLFR